MAESSGNRSGSVRADRGGIGFLLNQAARAVRARLSEELHVHGLGDADFILLRRVTADAQRDGSETNTNSVSMDLNMPLSAVVEAAERLRARGWLDVTGDGSDLNLRPTRRTQTVVPGLVDTARWTLEEALNGFSHDEIAALSGMLERIITNTRTSL